MRKTLLALIVGGMLAVAACGPSNSSPARSTAPNLNSPSDMMASPSDMLESPSDMMASPSAS